MIKRVFDVVAALAGLVLTLPAYPVIALAIVLDSPGGVLYSQIRVGRGGQIYRILKFRTMVAGAENDGPITAREDSRITRVGRWLRRFKADEWPTFVNVLKGDMSVVGPRPEIPLYVEKYTLEQRRVLSVRPGITDPGTLQFDNEADLLSAEDQSKDVYLERILPEKLRLNLTYIDQQSLLYDLKIIFSTLSLMARRGHA